MIFYDCLPAHQGWSKPAASFTRLIMALELILSSFVNNMVYILTLSRGGSDFQSFTQRKELAMSDRVREKKIT